MKFETIISRSKAAALAIVACCFAGSATTVTLDAAGTLAVALGDGANEIAELKVVGPVSNSDIKLLRNMAGRNDYNEPTTGQLTALDLSEAQIVANSSDGYYFKTYPKSNTTEDNVVGNNMFRDLNLKSLQLPAGVVKIGTSALSGCAIESLVVPAGVATIDSEAFSGCAALASIELPEGVTTIGSNAFQGCKSLTSIELPGITAIADGMMNGCSNLANVKIPGTVVSIGGNAFQNCSSLTVLTLPESVSSLGFWCLKGTALTELHCKGTVPPTTGYGVLEGVNTATCTLYVPEGATNAYKADTYWGAFANIEEEAAGETEVDVMVVVLTEPGQLASKVGEDNKYLVKDLTVSGPLGGSDLDFIRQMAGRDFNQEYTAGVLKRLDMSGATLVYQGTYNDYGLRVPVEADYYAYNEATIGGDSPIKMAARQDALPELVFTKTTLEEVILPTSIKKIYSSFSECYNLKGTVVIPEGVTTIGDYAFEGCYQVEEFVLPSTLVDVNSLRADANTSAICAHAFDGCSGLTSFVIPESVLYLRDAVFQNCSGLREITIPSGVKQVGQKAFGGCTGLRRINVEGTATKAYYQAFDGMDKDNCVVYVPSGSKAWYKDADEWFEFLSVVAHGETAQFVVNVNEAANVTVTDGSGATVALENGDNAVLCESIMNPLTIKVASGYAVEISLNGAAKEAATLAVGAGSTLTLKVTNLSGVKDAAMAQDAVSVCDGVIRAEGEIEVYAASGVKVASGNCELSVANLPAGIYFAKAGNRVAKFAK